MSRLRDEIAALDMERGGLSADYERSMRNSRAVDDRHWFPVGSWVRAATLDGATVGEGKIISRNPAADRFTVHFPTQGGTDMFGADQLTAITPRAHSTRGKLTRARVHSGGLTVRPTRIIGTDHVVFSVWEPYAGHSTMTTLDGKGMGRLGTRRLPPELDALPAGSEERIRRVGEWFEAQYREAYRAILAAYPEVSGGHRDMGEISITDHALALRLDPHKWRGE